MLRIWLNDCMETSKLQDIHSALVQHWSIQPVEEERMDREALLDELSRRVEFLLKHNYERLLSSMYMIDVPEEQFAEAIKRPPEEQPARAVAELILAREMQKVESRRRYMQAERREAIRRLKQNDE